MWSSSSPSATAFNPDWMAAIWVRTSMQYRSSATIFSTPRTCPSMRLSRLDRASFDPAFSYPGFDGSQHDDPAA